VSRTSIIATIGPSSSNPELIKKLALAGCSIFRLNLSHNDHDFHKKCAMHIREIEESIELPLGILMDLQGPKLRIGCFDEGMISLAPKEKFTLLLVPISGNSSHVSLPHSEIFDTISSGDLIFLDDGKIKLVATNNDGEKIETEVVEGGILSDRKGVNIPGIILPLSALTEKDKFDLSIVKEITADWIAVSFVQSAEDVLHARSLISSDIGIIAKIEKPIAIENIDSILEVSDAVMIARGDLGIEVQFTSIPAIELEIIRKARYHKKPAIVATQMLESMIHCHIPTRAEVTDVAFAAGCGADAVMLSAESASGDYPVESVGTMYKIITQSEKDKLKFIECGDEVLTNFAKSVKSIVETEYVHMVVIFTDSCREAIEIANARINARMIAFTTNLKTLRKLLLIWGITPFLTDVDLKDLHQMRQIAQSILIERFGATSGEKVAIIADNGKVEVFEIVHEALCDGIRRV
jgi:pyruvate kinase